MNKDWDHHKGGMNQWVDWMSEVMTECLRVTKPGGYLLCWSLPRTSHWTGQAIELAGWDIRDTVTHIFGSGFPKGQDIGKVIDKKLGKEREVVGSYVRPDGNPRNYNTWSGKQSGDLFDTSSKSVTAPASDEAKLWDGYKTTLKPACEFWWLAQKPIDGTYVNNCITHGCGALNIDETRVGNETICSHGGGINHDDRKYGGGNGIPAIEKGSNSHQGRYPANLILSHSPGCKKIGERQVKSNGSISGNEPSDPNINVYGELYVRKEFQAHGNGDGTETVEVWECADDCPIKLMGDQSGIKKSGWADKDVPKSCNRSVFTDKDSGYDQMRTGKHHNDSGTAARYFKNLEYNPFIYCAKASPKDRGTGNNHPTVKSTALMEYLLTIVKQPEVNLILDPFAGSGSTLVAAERLGMNSVGIEQNPDYIEIIKQRL